MKPRLSLSAAVAVVAVLGALAGSAHAQARAAAEVAFREGRALMKAGRYAEACKKLALSERLDPGAGTLANLGVCHQKLGKLASAWADLNEAADLAAQEGETKRAKTIRAYAHSLEPRLSRLRLRVAGPRPAGLAVTRDGKDVTLLLGAAVPVDPGTHVIEARAKGTPPWKKQVTVAGEGKTVTVEIPALTVAKGEAPAMASTVKPADRGKKTEPAEKAGPGQAEPSAENSETKQAVPGSKIGLSGKPSVATASATKSADRRRLRRRIAIGVGIGGLAAAAVGLGFGWHAHSQWNSSRQYCDSGNRCTPDGLSLINSAYSSANVANVLVGVGVAATVGAGVLWYLSRHEPQHAVAARIVPEAGASRLGLSVEGTF